MRVQPRTPNGAADHSVMRELNRSLVLDLIKAGSPISRAAIAKATALAKPTVSAIVDDLVRDGLVRQLGPGRTSAGGGRPPILLEFNARSQYLVGVHLGVRRTDILVADAAGAEVGRLQLDTPRDEPDAVLKEVATAVRRALGDAGAVRKRLAAIGIGVPGLVDMRSGRCLLAPNLGWHDVQVSQIMRRALGVPAFVHNSAQAAAVAETLDGAARGCADVVLLYAGSGVGAGILSDGKLYHGADGISGEIGHCRVPGATGRCRCGRTGCLETVASGPAIARAAKRAGLPADPERVAAAALDGDRRARDILAAAGRELGVAASWLINLCNPEIVVFAGGLSGAGDALFEPLRTTALSLALPQAAERVRIVTSALGQDAEVRGAVLVAMQSSETYYRLIFQG